MLLLKFLKPVPTANAKRTNTVTNQEVRGGKFLPAFFIEPVVLGQEIAAGQLPLHMTYFPPVKTSFQPALANLLREYVNPMDPFIATVGEDDFFGPNSDKPVRKMVQTQELVAVHRKILSVLQYLPHSTQYRTPYNPHISIAHDDTRIETGDSIEIGGFSIVEKPEYAEAWRVIAKIGLRGADMVTDARIIKKSEKK